MPRYSILDLVPITQGSDARCALERSKQLAVKAESWGYHRYWVAEHHNMPGIASAATAVVIGHIAGGTQSIRVGSGGVMLPNHAPLVIAEQFGTLESLYPGRIELGLGRAPGTDQFTAQALRRSLAGDVEQFPRDVQELQSYFLPGQTGQRVDLRFLITGGPPSLYASLVVLPAALWARSASAIRWLAAPSPYGLWAKLMARYRSSSSRSSLHERMHSFRSVFAKAVLAVPIACRP